MPFATAESAAVELMARQNTQAAANAKSSPVHFCSQRRFSCLMRGDELVSGA